MTITAEGSAVCKAVSVAEITKRRLRGLHQNTQIGLPTGTAGSSNGTPALTITLSLTPLDANQLGYAPSATR